MAKPIPCRNLELTEVAIDHSLGSDMLGADTIIDFKEMNTGFIQAVTTETPDALDGAFQIKVSLLDDPASFVHYPNSERALNADCNNFGWSFDKVTFRFAMVCYNHGSVSTGKVSIYARAKRT